MAKLHGVKTLDMVNGEITKVAYGGAEYERVEGVPRSVGRAGDLVLNGHRHSDLKLDGFYRLVWDEDTSRVSVLDEVGDLHGNALTDIDSVLFRKVTASQPALEDRVSTNEKDIESLKSDVAALKGEAKPEYVRIDKSEAKAGDFVKFVEAPNEYLTAGEYYEIYRVDGCGDPQIRDDYGDGFDTCDADDFEVYRKVSAAEPKPGRLKVGDYAKVVTDRATHAKRDDIVKIIDDDDKSVIPFLTVHLNGDNAGWFIEKHLVRATDEEVDEAKRAQFNEGAKVRLKSGGGEHPLLSFEDGKVYEVGDPQITGGWGDRIGITNGHISGFATPDQLELLPEEEVAEIEKWAAIGREVGEYKVGDIVQYLYDGEICEVVDVDEAGCVKVATQKYGTCTENQSSIELIAPVEARFDRKGDE
ncbi:hypothetical protein MOB41_16680 [Bacillus haynesii]|uniref:hypothetical protein n=1 Tax=Bacillus haynesii TaxID=1925021 RepID=UPI0022825CF0|nr:hypothetical protein [Bacillus haynesii]MCY7780036.1 hypothetical protein [Bacillus haynesii]MEC0669683.1 hypothetical protein [Bacillus haynesii]